MVVFLALLAATVSGTADYLGGRASTQHSALTVSFFTQSVNALLLPVFVVLIGWEHLHGGDVLLGLGAGVAAGTAYLLFFRGLADGRMSVIAPLAALTTAIVPLVADVIGGVSLRGGRWLGLVLALIAIPALAYRRDNGNGNGNGNGTMTLRAELVCAVLAGLGFAGFFMAIGHTDTESGQWPVAFAGIGAATTMGMLCLVQREPLRRTRPPRLAIWAGLCMVGSGLAINHALQVGPIAVATVLGSMYPLATTALAHRFDREPVGPTNVAGIVLAVAGASLVAVYR